MHVSQNYIRTEEGIEKIYHGIFDDAVLMKKLLAYVDKFQINYVLVSDGSRLGT